LLSILLEIETFRCKTKNRQNNNKLLDLDIMLKVKTSLMTAIANKMTTIEGFIYDILAIKHVTMLQLSCILSTIQFS